MSLLCITSLLLLLLAGVAHRCVASAPPPLPFTEFTVQFNETRYDREGRLYLTAQGSGAVSDTDQTECFWGVAINGSSGPLRETRLNFTSRTIESRVMLPTTGVAVNCSSSSIPASETYTAGGPFFTPSPTELAQLQFVGTVVVNGVQRSLYSGAVNASGNVSVLNWTVVTQTGIPVSYIRVQHDGDTVVLTYQNYVSAPLPGLCRSALTCGKKVCVARPDASPASLEVAIDWTCSQISCAPIQRGGPKFFPDSVEAHATWAFGAYFVTHESIDHDHACFFNGLGLLVMCPVNTSCVPRANATDEQLQVALKWVCSAAGLQDCSPIMPGGKYFLPNTTRHHAMWAFNAYYQPYKCVPGWDACDFGGTAEIVPIS